MISANSLREKSAHYVIDLVLANDRMRKLGLKYALKKLHETMVEDTDEYTEPIREERYLILRNLLYATDRSLANKNISARVREKILKNFMGKVFKKVNKEATEVFKAKYGRRPPGFMTISPTQRCNLKCPDCYASAPEKLAQGQQLSFDVVDRMITDKKRLWGSYFTVISGGEPFMWKTDGKTIFDIFEKHDDSYFMMYTNGTTITRKVAERMADVGNVTPSISVEGSAETTDRRRGKGAYDKILRAMGYLREVGVPFGISATATRFNAEEIMSDEFVDFFFKEQGALYGWVFQYMPIGTHPTLELMVTPEQRKWMFEREQYFLREKQIFYPDFWNSGVLAEGCLAAGRPGGYLYVDWHGNVTPCVFFPYSVHNINDVYAGGGSLNDVLESQLFYDIREFQEERGYCRCGMAVKNMIAPCAIRDHYSLAYDSIVASGAVPIDKNAKDAIEDERYRDGLIKYGQKFQSLTDPYWKETYLPRPEPTFKESGELDLSVGSSAVRRRLR